MDAPVEAITLPLVYPIVFPFRANICLNTLFLRQGIDLNRHGGSVNRRYQQPARFV